MLKKRVSAFFVLNDHLKEEMVIANFHNIDSNVDIFPDLDVYCLHIRPL